MPIIDEKIADIFDAPRNSILIRTYPLPPLCQAPLTRQSQDACNTKGAWGAGVALAMRKRYPRAYAHYHLHCITPPTETKLPKYQSNLVGTALLIPPSTSSVSADSGSRGEWMSDYWIACLFTSKGYGKNVSDGCEIRLNTMNALRDLRKKIHAVQKEQGKNAVGQCWSVRLNSKNFRVPWKQTKSIIKKSKLEIVVVKNPEDVGDTTTEDEMTDEGEESSGAMTEAVTIPDDDSGYAGETSVVEEGEASAYEDGSMGEGTKRKMKDGEEGPTKRMKKGIGCKKSPKKKVPLD